MSEQPTNPPGLSPADIERLSSIACSLVLIPVELRSALISFFDRTLDSIVAQNMHGQTLHFDPQRTEIYSARLALIEDSDFLNAHKVPGPTIQGY